MPDREQLITRQKVLADFGDFALRSDSLDDILNEACRLVGDALGTDLAKVLEIEPDGKCLLVRGGVGWAPGVVGKRRLPMGERSAEAYSMKVAEPVTVQDIARETRFVFPDLLRDHDVLAMANVPIFLPGGKPYGLLQVDSRSARGFDEEDVEFLRTYAIILGPVIDRLHKSHSLERALESNRNLLRELQHRVKNHLAIIASVVRLRARHTAAEAARAELGSVADRIETLGLIHDQLYATGSTEQLQLRPFIVRLLENLCRLHELGSGPIRLDFKMDGVELSLDFAVPLGLILNEFVTNSLRHAFDGSGGTISVRLTRDAEGGCEIVISDDGKGLSLERDRDGGVLGTGMNLIETLARQIEARLDWPPVGRGTALSLAFRAR